MTEPTPLLSPEALYQELLEFPKRFKQEISKVIVGQDAVLDLLVVALLSKGHVLLTGVPGLAKTLLVKSLARLFHLDFNRIQCTPDLMPSDITGVEILEEAGGIRSFRFIPGPVFTHLFLADEINRTSPRTQSALLQAMQEKQVTVSGKTHPLQDPFILFATQNPIDSEGTYLLPEAQLDRFLLNVHLSYPPLEEELQIAIHAQESSLDDIQPLFRAETFIQLQQSILAIPVASYLVQWAVQFVRLTRPQESTEDWVHRYVEWGAGVRASQSLILAAKAKAALSQRTAVHLEDLHAVVEPVLRHRIIMNFTAAAEGWDSVKVIQRLLKEHPGIA